MGREDNRRTSTSYFTIILTQSRAARLYTVELNDNNELPILNDASASKVESSSENNISRGRAKRENSWLVASHGGEGAEALAMQDFFIFIYFFTYRDYYNDVSTAKLTRKMPLIKNAVEPIEGSGRVVQTNIHLIEQNIVISQKHVPIKCLFELFCLIEYVKFALF